MTVRAPTIASSASITPKKPGPESRSLMCSPFSSDPPPCDPGAPAPSEARPPGAEFVHSIADVAEAVSEEPLGCGDVPAELILVLRDLRQVLLNDVRRRTADEEVEAEQYHRDVVQLTENGDEIRDEIDRKEKVSADPREDELLPCGNAAITEQRPHQADVRRQAPDDVHHLGHVLRNAYAVIQRGPLPAGTVPEARAG